MEPQTLVTVEHLATDQMEHLAVVVQQPTTEHLVMGVTEVQHTSLEVEVVEAEMVTEETELSVMVDLDTTMEVKDLTQVNTKQQMVENQLEHLAVLEVI